MTAHIHKWRVLSESETQIYEMTVKHVLVTCDGCGEIKKYTL